MNGSKGNFGWVVPGFGAVCLAMFLWVAPAAAADEVPYGFDSGGEKIFTRYNETPLAAMTGTDGRRNLDSFYGLRQYPGSPPRIPHKVAPAFFGNAGNCLACHGRGGFDAEQDAYAPVTPHPENELCYQCHVPRADAESFKDNNWLSVAPPKLGKSQLSGSPPPIPHSLQLRADCIACHTGPAAVAEIRVEHATRGNCRQCHVQFSATEPVLEFSRRK